jgi:S1-C subfamily serine protease
MFRKLALLLVAMIMVGGVLFAAGLGVARVAAASASSAGQLQTTVQRALSPVTNSAAQGGSTAAATPAPATITVPAGVEAQSKAMETVYQKVNPSVVEIINMAANPNSGINSAVPQAEGSGFVWNSQGDIVTNDHVVQGATQLQVVFSDGTTVSGTVVGKDPNGDIAVVKVDPSQAPLVPVSQGNMANVQVGEQVLAIGNPFGFSGTMTQGIVSAMSRTIPALTQFSIPGAIQTDAAINPGNSGGPLLTLQGQVIGVNDQIQSSSGSSSGVGFAIPINEVQRIVPSLIKTGQYNHPYLGIQGATLSSTWAKALGFPANAKGVYITGLLPGGPAANAGLQAGSQNTSVLLGTDQFGQPTYLQSGGDLLTAVNGHSLKNIDDLLNYLEDNASAGQTVQFTVLRSGGQQQTVNVTLGARPQQLQTQTGG